MSTQNGILRYRDGHEARVSFVELFFDLIYVFCVTQLSHYLVRNLNLEGALQTLLLWFAVWLGWQYTCWVTNWFNPENMRIRLMLFVLMIVGLIMAAAIPVAFSDGALTFALSYAFIQVGRTVYVLFLLGRKHALTPNFQRILGWTCIAAVFWIAGALTDDTHLRFTLWGVGILSEYISPMFGFRLPGLGRSHTSDWTIEGGHLAERCQLFVIVALGESIIMTGATLGGMKEWSLPLVISYAVAFLTSIAMWWIYFDTSSKDGSHAIASSKDPGRMGAYFHYLHVILVAGIIVSAVAAELILAHPDGHIETKYVAVILGGPLIYLIGNAVYKRIIYGSYPLSHLAGIAALLILIPFSYMTDLLMVGGLSVLILLAVAMGETCSTRHHKKSH